MGSIILMCPMCCGETFSTTELLKKHLQSMRNNIFCPRCSSKYSSIAELCQHLDDCKNAEKSSDEDEKEQSEHQQQQIDELVESESMEFEEVLESSDEQDADENNQDVNTNYLTIDDDGFIMSEGRMVHVDENGDICILDKVNEKNSESTNIKNNFESKKKKNLESANASQVFNSKDEVLSNNSNAFLLNESDNALMGVTEDSNIQLEFDDSNSIIVKDETNQSLDSHKETRKLFLCNSCGMSFYDPNDHMDRFHGGQKYEEVKPDEDEIILPTTTIENVTPVEDTNLASSTALGRPTRAAKRKALKTLRTEQCVDSNGRLYTRKVVKIERFWDRTPITLSTIKAPMIEKFFSNVEGVRIKDKSVTVVPKKMYRCNQCLEQFSKISDFKVHECPLGSYECDHCDQTFTNTKTLQKHLKTHDLEDPSLNSQLGFVCKKCGTKFSSHKSLALHSRMHMPVKSRHVDAPEGTGDDTFNCTECGATLSESYRAAHMALHDNNAVTCGQCNRKFDSPASLSMHAAVHVESAAAQAAASAAAAADLLHATTAQKSLDAMLTNAGINTPIVSGPSVVAAVEAAAAAEDAEASKDKPYQCQHCGRRFSRPHEKVKHERIHTGEKPHVCEVCGKKFRVSYCLTLHMRTHTGVRPYECQHCGKRFKASSVYNHHLLTHGDERAFTCPYCPKTFKTRVQLAGHKNSHTKPFRCTECSRPFASLYAARSHMETHKKENNLKYSCSICGASYGRAFAVKDHMKQAHGQEIIDEILPEAAREEEVQEMDDNFMRTEDDVENQATDEIIVPHEISNEFTEFDLAKV